MHRAPLPCHYRCYVMSSLAFLLRASECPRAANMAAHCRPCLAWIGGSCTGRSLMLTRSPVFSGPCSPRLMPPLFLLLMLPEVTT